MQCSKGYNHLPFHACVHTCTTCIRTYTHALTDAQAHTRTCKSQHRQMHGDRLTGVLEQLHSQIVLTFTSTDPKKPLDNISLKGGNQHAIDRSMACMHAYIHAHVQYMHTHMCTHIHVHTHTCAHTCTHTWNPEHTTHSSLHSTIYRTYVHLS